MFAAKMAVEPRPKTDTLAESLLGLILDHHPGLVTAGEIVRLIAFDGNESAESDDLLVALNDLVGHGLVHRHGDFVFASVAAVRFNELAGPSVKA